MRTKKTGDRRPKTEVRRLTRNSQLATCKTGAWSLRFSAYILILFLLTLGSCHSGTQKATQTIKSDESGVAKFVFSEEIHNFGSLKAGEIVSFTYIFRNEGTKTLTITGVDSGCGCTEVKIENKNIEPGQEGRIEVIYNSAGEVGRQLKTITLFSNAETAQKQLYLKANVSNDIIELNS
jgi:hypothetical protein